MIRLLHIEWLKVSHSRYFKIMVGLWLLAFLIVPFGIDSVISWLEDKGTFEAGAQFGIGTGQLPIFDFTDLWQNLAWVYKLMTFLLSLIIIVNVGQEWEEKTMRQNIIDGMSRTEYFTSKMLLVSGFAVISTMLLLIMGLVIGFIYSPDTSFAAITGHIDFLWAYGLHVLLQLNLAFLLINALRKVGLTIILFVIYWVFIEPLLAGISNLLHELSGAPKLSIFLPLEASSNLIPMPFLKYVLQPTADHVAIGSVAIALGWLVLTTLVNYRLTAKRDLR